MSHFMNMVNNICCFFESRKYYYINLFPNLSCFILGIFLLSIGCSGLLFAANDAELGGSSPNAIIKKQLCKILGLLEGAFGALVMVVAGLAAVVTAAIGAYKMAMSCVVIACGTYIVEAFAKLFFGKYQRIFL
jgi:type IV secretory pathway VirB2 component (pilin)